MEILANILKAEHREAGLCLDEDDHMLYLRNKEGKILAMWWATNATVEEVLREATQQWNWLKSGIEFVREGLRGEE